MNILLITVRSDFGGGPRHVHQLIETLPSEINVYLVCPLGEPYGSLWENHSRIEAIYKIPFRKFSLKKLIGLRKFIKTNKIDIIHSHGNGAGFYSRLVKLICPRVKVIHTFHGLTDNYQSKVKKFLSLIFTRLFKVLTDRFILVSKGELNIAKKLKAVNKNRVHIIYNGIEKPSCTERFNSATFDIVTLSRFDYQKNMDLAYKIACRFKRNRHIRFIWVGDGGDFDRLKQKSKDEDINIIFTGFSTTPFVHLLSSSVYLSTARFEGLPYALIEAISVGLPIIATDVTGNNEIVINNHNGYLFNTVDEAVESINKLYHNRERLSEMSIQSKKLFKAKFTIESMIGELVLVYNELIKTS